MSEKEFARSSQKVQSTASFQEWDRSNGLSAQAIANNWVHDCRKLKTIVKLIKDQSVLYSVIN
jgi:hypothetical protein